MNQQVSDLPALASVAAGYIIVETVRGGGAVINNVTPRLDGAAQPTITFIPRVTSAHGVLRHVVPYTPCVRMTQLCFETRHTPVV